MRGALTRRPPRLWRSLLSALLLPGTPREMITADLDEEFDWILAERTPRVVARAESVAPTTPCTSRPTRSGAPGPLSSNCSYQRPVGLYSRGSWKARTRSERTVPSGLSTAGW